LGFSRKYLEKIRKKEDLVNIKQERQKLNSAYIFFAYLNKANVCLKQQQFESTIRLMNTAVEKYLKSFPVSSNVYKRGELLVTRLKSKITSCIEEKLSTWLVSISREQNIIGETLFRKLKAEDEKISYSKGYFNKDIDNSSIKFKGNIRTTKNIVDNLLLIRNTANLNYLMNKNSVLKSSILKDGEGLEEMDIVNMVSNVDLNFLEGIYTIYKKVDIDTKFIEHFINFRQVQLQSLIKFNKNNESTIMSDKNLSANKNSLTIYESYFTEILGYIIIQLAIYELLPLFYSKRKFDEIINFFLKNLISNLSFEFNNLKTYEDFLNLQHSIFLFTNCLDRIGLVERVGIDIKSSLIELMKEKTEELNYLLINKYNNLFLNLLFEEKFILIEVKNYEEYMNYAGQYSININTCNPHNSMYPYKLPFTNFVIEVNESFKKYVDELYSYILPLYTEYENVLRNLVKNFLKKINEVFHSFSNLQEQELNIILAAHICNNIKFISQSKSFYSSYVMTKSNKKESNFSNGLQSQSIFTEDSLQNTWESYEEIIYENLKNKIRQFMNELIDENWTPEKSINQSHAYVDNLIGYLTVIYESLQNLSQCYIENSFNDSLNFITKMYFNEMFFINGVKNYNIYFIDNLKLDVEALEEFFIRIGYNLNSLYPIKKLLNFFYSKKIEPFFEKQNGDTYEIKIASLINFLGKYKNVKKNDMKGKISESDVSSLVKKLKEHIK
jgi:hypothetical protein